MVRTLGQLQAVGGILRESKRWFREEHANNTIHYAGRIGKSGEYCLPGLCRPRMLRPAGTCSHVYPEEGDGHASARLSVKRLLFQPGIESHSTPLVSDSSNQTTPPEHTISHTIECELNDQRPGTFVVSGSWGCVTGALPTCCPSNEFPNVSLVFALLLILHLAEIKLISANQTAKGSLSTRSLEKPEPYRAFASLGLVSVWAKGNTVIDCEPRTYNKRILMFYLMSCLRQRWTEDRPDDFIELVETHVFLREAL